MEEDDKGCPMMWMGVSGCFFWYRPTRVVPDKSVKWLCVCSTQYSFQLRALWCILIKITVFDVSVLFI